MLQQFSSTSKFKPCYNKIRELITIDQFKQFENCNENIKRFQYIYELGGVQQQLPNIIDCTGTNKSLNMALELKENGNKAFLNKLDTDALHFYNLALLKMPIDSDKNLAIIIANRSAVLHHLKQYRFALIDIKSALKLNYPIELKYKLYERKARCCLALKLHTAALQSFKKTLSALSDCQLKLERRKQMEMDIQIMISMLSKDKHVQTNQQHLESIHLELTKTRNEYLDTVSGNQNKQFPTMSDSIRIDCSDKLGRYAIADKKIIVGDILLSEKASCAVLASNLALTHCQHCFIKTIAPIACNSCDSVIFCSNLCKNEAFVYHQYECKILSKLWDSGISIICLMALRFITQQTLTFFQKLQLNKINDKQLKMYKNILKLVTHKEQRSTEDYFHRTIMSIFLLNCLEQTNYFSNNKNDANHSMYFIGGLIITFLEISQFNAHEVSELDSTSKSIFLGGALYPTLALFNHSCDPGIIRYFHGTSVIVRAAKNIKSGEIVAENYGPIYSQSSIVERRQLLREQYWFDCNCTPCLQNWPLFNEMESNILRFRCQGGKNCPNIILVNSNSDQIFLYCNLCNQNTNIFKGLKSLQETELLNQTANKLMEQKEYGKALQILINILTILDNVLKPPFKDFLLCQQNIRRCMLQFGNKTQC